MSTGMGSSGHGKLLDLLETALCFYLVTMTVASEWPLDPHTESENSKLKVEPGDDTGEGQVPRLTIRSQFYWASQLNEISLLLKSS